MREVFTDGAINWREAEPPLKGRVLVTMTSGHVTFAIFEDGEWVDDANCLIEVSAQANPPKGWQR